MPAARQEEFKALYAPSKHTIPDGLVPKALAALDINADSIDRLVSTWAKESVEVNPNLVLTWAASYRSDPSALTRLEPQFALERDRQNWSGKPHPYGPPPPFVRLAHQFYAFDEQLVLKLHRAGVLLTAGTDLANPWMTPGVSLHVELQLLQTAGIPAGDVLRIATSNRARALGVADRLGTMQEGKLADLVVLGANPLSDIANTRRIVSVVRGRRIHTPDALLKP